ncbi:MAG: CatB-related O-acetyltransferase [Selenomonadaceae bacterium]|nr:CatB-related O-acetyltransferase [Selenomonadaceae bacterium]
MAYKTLLFGTDDLFKALRPFYEQEIQRGHLEIVGYAVIENGKVNLFDVTSKPEEEINFDLAIISSKRNFYERMKFLESTGVSRDHIIDGRVFKVPYLNFPRLLEEKIAYGILEAKSFCANSYTIYPQIYGFKNKDTVLIFDKKSYINPGGTIIGKGLISVGKYSSIGANATFALSENYSHNYRNVSTMPVSSIDCDCPEELFQQEKPCKIIIGSDVWIGRGCHLKSNNPEKPLIIGDGAVIATNSVVVKNVPPYAIVGGNPAQIIKPRFPPYVINAMLRIKWWDWSLDKICDNLKYFNDVERFISMHDR